VSKTVDELNSQSVDEDFSATPLRVAYQGVPGAYSEMAALKAIPTGEPYPCAQFETAFQTVSQWMADRAVLPVENSLGGSIHSVYDLLLRYRLHIVGETSVAVDHYLLALPGVKLSDLKRAISHPQALAQCDGYLRALGVVREAVDDTAGAAMEIAKHGWKDTAAVASSRAADLYGLERLDASIQDNKVSLASSRHSVKLHCILRKFFRKSLLTCLLSMRRTVRYACVQDNVTRFIVLSRDPLLSLSSQTEAGAAGKADGTARKWKTSIVFSLSEGKKPGQLFKAMSVFALRDIDLTKIESRPMRSQPLVLGETSGSLSMRRFNYLFYVDFIGSLSDEHCQNALRHLQEICPFMRVLGSYPVDTTI
jgi:arogenate/prephenate dehydratase